MYRIFTFREFKSIHKGKTAILHLRFGTEKNRRLGSKKAQYNRAFRRRHLFCLHIMAQMVHSLGSLPCSPTRTRPSKQPPAVSLLRNRLFESLRLHNKKSRRQKAVGIFGADGEIRTLAAVTHPTPLAGAPRHQLEYICKTVNLNTHCQVVAPIRCLTNIPKRSKKVNTKFI